MSLGRMVGRVIVYVKEKVRYVYIDHILIMPKRPTRKRTDVIIRIMAYEDQTAVLHEPDDKRCPVRSMTSACRV